MFHKCTDQRLNHKGTLCITYMPFIELSDSLKFSRLFVQLIATFSFHTRNRSEHFLLQQEHQQQNCIIFQCYYIIYIYIYIYIISANYFYQKYCNIECIKSSPVCPTSAVVHAHDHTCGHCTTLHR